VTHLGRASIREMALSIATQRSLTATRSAEPAASTSAARTSTPSSKRSRAVVKLLWSFVRSWPRGLRKTTANCRVRAGEPLLADAGDGASRFPTMSGSGSSTPPGRVLPPAPEPLDEVELGRTRWCAADVLAPTSCEPLTAASASTTATRSRSGAAPASARWAATASGKLSERTRIVEFYLHEEGRAPSSSLLRSGRARRAWPLRPVDLRYRGRRAHELLIVRATSSRSSPGRPRRRPLRRRPRLRRSHHPLPPQLHPANPANPIGTRSRSKIATSTDI